VTITMFQSTRPRGARLVKLKRAWVSADGFNPRARVGRDRSMIAVNDGKVPVSIHAPAWGATGVQYDSIDDSLVSIHAPAWGATWGGDKSDGS